MKYVRVLIIVVLSLTAVGWLALHILIASYVGVPKSYEELKEQAEVAIKSLGGVTDLEKEAKISIKSLRAKVDRTTDYIKTDYITDEKEYPAIMKLRAMLSPYGHDPWINSDQPGLPAHVVVRFGSHAHYVYVLIYDPADIPLAKIKSVEHLSGTVYLSESKE